MTREDESHHNPTGAARAELAWGVRSSFRSYVEEAGGSIVVSAPATVRGNEFIFPAEPDTAAEPPGEPLRFTGQVRFSAHRGALHLVIRDPWIHNEGDRLRLSVAGSASTGGEGGRLFMADLTGGPQAEINGVVVRSAVSASLATEGLAAFNFTYVAGEQLAPLTFGVRRSELIH